MSLPRKCVCGWDIPGDDDEARFAAMRAHSIETHAALELDDYDVRNFLEALDRMDPPGSRLEVVGPIETHRVTPDRIADFLEYFDCRAYADYPIWGACYCMAHHLTDSEPRTAAQNRAEITSRLESGATTGYLAYVDGLAVGWCNASSRSAYPHYDTDVAGGRVGAIVCFVVAAPYRRHGVAAALLDAALKGFRSDGFSSVEAYPRRQVDADSSAYHGPLPMYLGAGFAEVGETEHWVVVRKDLT
jgi:GNAT superfamily N-acetyltransferase